MLRIDNRDFSTTFIILLWLLMSFQAGYINVGGFLIFGNYVSHVTGTSSQIGMGIGLGDAYQILSFLLILFAFISGAAFSGHFLSRKIEENKNPRYLFVSFVKMATFGVILLLSEYHFSIIESNLNFLIIFLLSFCCGVQNSTCSIATNGFLKPTHMTGLSTDIGIHLTKIRCWKNNPMKYKEERNKNILRIGILISFIFGGSIASIIFSNKGHHGFLFPFLSSFCLFILAYLYELKINSKLAFRFAHKFLWFPFLLTLIIGLYETI